MNVSETAETLACINNGGNMINGKEIVLNILKRNEIKNVKVITKSNKSRCKLKINGDIEIFLADEEKKADELLVAAHESSHAVNYRNRKSNYLLLFALEKSLWVSFTILFFSWLIFFIGTIFLQKKLSMIYIDIMTTVSSSFVIIYGLYYKRDENLAEKTALIELDKEPQVKGNNELMCLIKKSSENRIKVWINRKVNIGIPILITMFFATRFLLKVFAL